MAELTSMLIIDPDQEEGVVQSIPLDALPVRLLDGYSSEKLVRCQFCRQRQKHYRGFFVELNNGAKALAGNCCATQIGGQARVAEIKRDIAKKERNANALREKQILHDRLMLMESEIEEKWLPAEEAINSAIISVYRFMEIQDIPSCSTFSGIISRLRRAREKCQLEYYKHRDRIVSDLGISVAAARRGQKEIAIVAGRLDRENIRNLGGNCPLARFHGPGILISDEISFLVSNEFDGTKSRITHTLPFVTLPNDDIEELLRRVSA